MPSPEPAVVFRPIGLRPSVPTAARRDAPFNAGFRDTLALLCREAALLGATSVAVGIDVPPHAIRADGLPRVDARPASPAVAVSFDSRYGYVSFGTDRFREWTDNLRAVALALKALRTVDRYGVSGHGEQYAGWADASSEFRDAEAAARWIAERTQHPRYVDPAGAGWRGILASEGNLEHARTLAASNLRPEVVGDADGLRVLQDAYEVVAAAQRAAV